VTGQETVFSVRLPANADFATTNTHTVFIRQILMHAQENIWQAEIASLNVMWYITYKTSTVQILLPQRLQYCVSFAQTLIS